MSPDQSQLLLFTPAPAAESSQSQSQFQAGQIPIEKEFIDLFASNDQEPPRLSSPTRSERCVHCPSIPTLTCAHCYPLHGVCGPCYDERHRGKRKNHTRIPIPCQICSKDPIAVHCRDCPAEAGHCGVGLCKPCFEMDHCVETNLDVWQQRCTHLLDIGGGKAVTAETYWNGGGPPVRTLKSTASEIWTFVDSHEAPAGEGWLIEAITDEMDSGDASGKASADAASSGEPSADEASSGEASADEVSEEGSSDEASAGEGSSSDDGSAGEVSKKAGAGEVSSIGKANAVEASSSGEVSKEVGADEEASSADSDEDEGSSDEGCAGEGSREGSAGDVSSSGEASAGEVSKEAGADEKAIPVEVSKKASKKATKKSSVGEVLDGAGTAQKRKRQRGAAFDASTTTAAVPEEKEKSKVNMNAVAANSKPNSPPVMKRVRKRDAGPTAAANAVNMDEAVPANEPDVERWKPKKRKRAKSATSIAAVTAASTQKPTPTPIPTPIPTLIPTSTPAPTSTSTSMLTPRPMPTPISTEATVLEASLNRIRRARHELCGSYLSSLESSVGIVYYTPWKTVRAPTKSAAKPRKGQKSKKAKQPTQATQPSKFSKVEQVPQPGKSTMSTSKHGQPRKPAGFR
ncbi:uncharacterized protein EV422DRAFT_123756 [Fimicolochytrium jonesii]|uniref:uncharacterized protein n=1 Tax=Fimicolochytrium jonesii TaxID=1396493 RepID=UPI0022FF1CED|nr:uncharacterized protein EV422DRAFT_123756 [Fimicolochytrium jonesii]KAI8818879.1 hypothetical protein EV422DRAFT_123756 [Fimicolochytrium jonesii]